MKQKSGNEPPDSPEAYKNRGNICYGMGRFKEALHDYDQAIQLAPEDAEAWSNRGSVLSQLECQDEAIASCQQALSLNPQLAEAHNNLGNALKLSGRFEEALACYGRALALPKPCLNAWGNRAALLTLFKYREEALADYEQAFARNPGEDFLFGSYLSAKMALCRWDSLTENRAVYAQKIRNHLRVTQPFVALALLDDPALHQQAAQTYVAAKCPANPEPGPISKRPPAGKIRIGYYSADFHNHATAWLMAELFEIHDRERFEFYAFSFGPDVRDEMRERVAAAFDRFIDVRILRDVEVARMSRELEIDIAIDLKGYTQDSRPGIFAARAAPVQVNYLGYPGTMGADYIDYLIADATVIPKKDTRHFREKVVWLPHCYQVNDRHRAISPRVFSRTELGLPEDAFVFCCFNNSYKILPEVFDRWMRILAAVEGSVLWLLADQATTETHLRRKAEMRGVRENRLVFAQRMLLADHLARHRAADLFLDTLPYNAHTTASDALWAGLPVLTCTGRSFASRVAASLLKAIGLPELVTDTPAAYEEKAIALARCPTALQALREKIAANRLSAPLFDTPLFARHIEAAYATMFARYQADLPPTHFSVKAEMRPPAPSPVKPLAEAADQGRFWSMAKSGRKILLHAGCGTATKASTLPGFQGDDWQEIRLDIDPCCAPDIVANLIDLKEIPTASVDAVYAAHSLNHIFAHQVPRALGEFRRILKPDGFAIIICPDLKAVCRRVAEGHLMDAIDGPITPHDALYGHGKAIAEVGEHRAHRCGFTLETLRNALEKAGFAESTGGEGSNDLYVIARKIKTSEAILLRFFLRSMGQDDFLQSRCLRQNDERTNKAVD